mgnify:CR=1 FL=1
MTTGPAITRWQPAAVTVGTESPVLGEGCNISDTLSPIKLSPPDAGFRSGPQTNALALADLHVTPYPVSSAVAENRRESPQKVSLPACVTGALAAARTEQAWLITGVKGKKLRVSVATNAIASQLDAVLRVFDVNEKKLLDVDDAAKDEFEIVTEFNPPADGEYTIVIGDRFWHGGVDYVYTLSIAESGPDFALTVPGDAFVVRPDKALEISVSIDRRFGLSTPIGVSVEGLPEGVTAEAATSEPKGDSSKSVKLKLTSTRDAEWIGPIRIVGRTGEGDELRRWARVTPAEGQQVTPPLLLKVLGKPDAEAKKAE